MALEFRPDGFFAVLWTVRHPPKSMMKIAILPKDTRTQLNATCRPKSAKAPGSLDLGVRYLTLFFFVCYSQIRLDVAALDKTINGFRFYLYSLIDSAQRLAELEAGRDQVCVLLTM